jgi:ribonuclease T1
MRRTVLILFAIALALVAIAAVFRHAPGGRRATAPAGSPSPGETPAGRPAVPTAPAPRAGQDGASRQDPALARARDVLAAIEARDGQPLPGYVGGRTFQNRERRLPAGRYREYDLHPRVPGQDRGAERLIVERATGRAYYTGDHYRTFVPLN